MKKFLNIGSVNIGFTSFPHLQTLTKSSEGLSCSETDHSLSGSSEDTLGPLVPDSFTPPLPGRDKQQTKPGKHKPLSSVKPAAENEAVKFSGGKKRKKQKGNLFGDFNVASKKHSNTPQEEKSLFSVEHSAPDPLGVLGVVKEGEEEEKWGVGDRDGVLSDSSEDSVNAASTEEDALPSMNSSVLLEHSQVSMTTCTTQVCFYLKATIVTHYNTYLSFII